MASSNKDILNLLTPESSAHFPRPPTWTAIRVLPANSNGTGYTKPTREWIDDVLLAIHANTGSNVIVQTM